MRFEERGKGQCDEMVITEKELSILSQGASIDHRVEKDEAVDHIEEEEEEGGNRRTCCRVFVTSNLHKIGILLKAILSTILSMSVIIGCLYKDYGLVDAIASSTSTNRVYVLITLAWGLFNYLALMVRDTVMFIQIYLSIVLSFASYYHFVSLS
jgi:hypothetical protein